MKNTRILALILTWSLCLVALAAFLAVAATPAGAHASAPDVRALRAVSGRELPGSSDRGQAMQIMADQPISGVIATNDSPTALGSTTILTATLVSPTQAITQFEDDFTTDKGWTNNSGGFFFRDVANARLDWQARRDTDQRYYIAIPAVTGGEVSFRFRINVDAWLNNDWIDVGLAETLADAYGGTGQPNGLFVRTGFFGGGTSDQELYIAPFGSYTDQPGWSVYQWPNQPETYVDYLYDTWYQVGMALSGLDWTMSVYEDDGVTLRGQLSGTMPAAHGSYNYFMIMNTNTGDWPWGDGWLDDVQVIEDKWLVGDVTYDWAYDDGQVGIGAVVSHTYPAVGVYTAVVTASNSVSLVTATTSVTITDVPVAGLVASNDSPTPLGEATALTATVSAGSNVSYTWAYGDGDTGSGAVTSHPYAAVGIYTAVVTASNSVSLVTATTSVTITDVPVADLVASNDSPTPLGEATALTATVSAGSNISYTWDFGDGDTGSGALATHTYFAVGVYTAMVTASNSVSLLTATTEAVVDEPIASLVASNDSPTPLGEATALTATVSAGSNISYTWDFGDGDTGSGALATHTYSAVGVYTAVVTASNSVSLLTATTEAVVDEPIASLAASNDSPTPLGETTALTATVSAGSHVTYTWAFGDGDTGSGAVTSHLFASVGVYTAVVTASNSVSQLTATTEVVVDEAIAGLVASNDSPTPLGEVTALTATVSAGSNVSYTWAFGDEETGSGALATHTYSAVGIYTAVVTVSNPVSQLTTTTTVRITGASFSIYLPIVVRNVP